MANLELTNSQEKTPAPSQEKKITARGVVSRAKELIKRHGGGGTLSLKTVPSEKFKRYRKLLISYDEEEFIDFLISENNNHSNPFAPLGYIEAGVNLSFLHYAIYYEKYLLTALISTLLPHLWGLTSASGRKPQDLAKNEELVSKIKSMTTKRKKAHQRKAK